MIVLVINCGSSSLKFQLIDTETTKVLAKGLCERIGIDGSITYTADICGKITKEVSMPTHKEAISTVLSMLTDEKTGAIDDINKIDAIGHRVVHGGEKFASSVVIDDEVIAQIEECSDLAPLHNPANLIGIRACMDAMPGKPNVAVFDTAFHQTMPPAAYTYPIPKKYYKKYKIRRYGFHGTSHSYVSKRVAKLLGKPYDEVKTIVCHLGNGASICAVDKGKSVDTSMGLTPLSGVMMGTRSGDIDPSIINHIAQIDEKSALEVTNKLNKESGMLGLTGISSDFRDIMSAAESGDEDAKTALDVYVRTIVRFVGGYIAVMNGVDAIAFTAGIGENNNYIRKKVLEHFTYMGIELDEEANSVSGEEMLISTKDSKVKVFAIPTNEELAIARETVSLI